MAERWRILTLLFVVRAAMAFQFQAIGALSPYLMTSYGIGLAEIGLMAGIYLAPGIALALAGGRFGARFGDRRIVAVGLVLMLIGAILAMVAPAWETQIVARLLAGTGGVLLNVLMSKMVSDWFSGREIGTAMAIFVNSWPCGIALALLVLAPLAEAGGLAAALVAVTGYVAIALILFVTRYPTPEAEAAAGTVVLPIPRSVKIAVLFAGGVWGLFNAAFAMIFTFGATILIERGWQPAEAAVVTSVVLWLSVLSIPAGGVLADRSGRPLLLLILSTLGFATLLTLFAAGISGWWILIALGVVGGLPAGPIMSLPAVVLPPANRAVGMGFFFTVFYATVVVSPIIAGAAADWSGTAAAAYGFGTGALVLSLLCLAIYACAAAEAVKPAPAGTG